MPAFRTRNYIRGGLEVNTDMPNPIVPHYSPYSPSTSTLYSPTTEYSPSTAYSPTSPTASWSPVSPTASKRRKSSATTEEVGTRPKKGDEGYVKRPENAFILFRRQCCEERQAALDASPSAVPVKKQRQADLSKTISQQWKALKPSERATWEALAKERKKEHELLHPGYVYRPQRLKGKAAAARRASAASTDTDSDAFVPPRFVVAPHPAYAPSFQVPSLMPMINSGSFDFVPQPPSFEQQCESSFLPYPVYDQSYGVDPFSMPEPSMLAPAFDISSSESCSSTETPPPSTPYQYPDQQINAAGMFEVPYGGYGSWDDAAIAMWPQDQSSNDLFDFDLDSIAPVQVGYQWDASPQYTVDYGYDQYCDQ